MQDWNEIQYLRWDEFRQMAPPILKLEIDRLGTLIDARADDPDRRNALVRARYELNTCITNLESAHRGDVQQRCGQPLQAALLALSFQGSEDDLETQQTLRYILDRLNYIYQRIALIY